MVVRLVLVVSLLCAAVAFQPLRTAIKAPLLFAEGFGSSGAEGVARGKGLRKWLAPVVASLAVFLQKPEMVTARTSSPTRATRHAARPESSRRQSQASRRAAVELVVEAEEGDNNEVLENRNTADHEASKSKNKRLTELGLVFALATIVNTVFFDTPTPARRRGGKGVGEGSKKCSGFGDGPVSPFQFRALSVEKGKLSGMMHELDATLSSTGNDRTPVTPRARRAALKEEASDALFDMDADADYSSSGSMSSGGSDDQDGDFFLDDDLVARRSKASSSAPAPFKGKNRCSATRMPSEEDFFADDPDDLFTSDGPTSVEAEAEEQFQKAFEDEDEENPDDDVAAAPKAAAEAAPRPKKKGILGRIFKRGGDGRPTDLGTVLMDDADGEDMQLFKAAVARALLSDVPADLKPELREELGGTLDLAGGKDLLVKTKDAAGLDSQAAAEAFAAVASCVVVAMVDRAAAIGGRREEEEEERLDALNAVAAIMDSMGELFGAIGDGARIDPVVYNGGTKKGKVENLYLQYARDAMALGDMLGAMGMSAAAGEGGDETAAAATAVTEAPKVDAETKIRRLGQLQQVLGIREKKRADVESKVMREGMMSMLKGDGLGEAGLGGLLESLGGALGGGDGDMDPAALEKMVAELGGMEGMEGMEGMKEMMSRGGGGGGAGDFDPNKMDPAELQAMSKDAMGVVQSSLSQGAISREDVAELEKMMGGNMDELLGVMQGGNVDKNKLKELGPDFQELLKVFKDLSDIKNQ